MEDLDENEIDEHGIENAEPATWTAWTQPTVTSTSHGRSVFSHLRSHPYVIDRDRCKVPCLLNLLAGAGVYLTDEGKPIVLDVVWKAERMLVKDRSRVKNYLPVAGLADFNKLSAKLIFGHGSPAIQENRVATVQCLSGTGALRLGAEFLARHYHRHIIYIPDPTWEKHLKIFTAARLSVKSYRYVDTATHQLNFQGLLEDLCSAPSGAIVLLQACAHNPTGIDPTLEQWKQVRRLLKSKALLPFFDCAFQGFATGNLDLDAQSVRMFVADGCECLVAQSYSKNMGLYGERVGALNFVCSKADVARNVQAELQALIEPMYSSPPMHGASIVATILKDRNGLYKKWRIELKAMSDRLISIRHKLFEALRARGTPGDWHHIINQAGMFTSTGLNSEQVDFIIRERQVRIYAKGMICMTSLNSMSVPHFADAIHATVTRSS